MKIKVNIYTKEGQIKIADFTTSAKDIQKAFYSWVSKRYDQLNVCATECYYRLSDV